MIQVKNADILVSLLQAKFHPTLTALIKWVALVSGIFITEGQRKKTHKHDLHGTKPLVRAIDGRASIYTHPGMVADRINAKWIYDPDRPHMKCALYHARCPKCSHDHQDTFKTNCIQCGDDIGRYWHIHWQVHPKTVFMKDGKDTGS